MATVTKAHEEDIFVRFRGSYIRLQGFEKAAAENPGVVMPELRRSLQKFVNDAANSATKYASAKEMRGAVTYVSRVGDACIRELLNDSGFIRAFIMNPSAASALGECFIAAFGVAGPRMARTRFFSNSEFSGAFADNPGAVSEVVGAAFAGMDRTRTKMDSTAYLERLFGSESFRGRLHESPAATVAEVEKAASREGGLWMLCETYSRKDELAAVPRKTAK
jgi:hypothetical protein